MDEKWVCASKQLPHENQDQTLKLPAQFAKAVKSILSYRPPKNASNNHSPEMSRKVSKTRRAAKRDGL